MTKTYQNINGQHSTKLDTTLSELFSNLNELKIYWDKTVQSLQNTYENFKGTPQLELEYYLSKRPYIEQMFHEKIYINHDVSIEMREYKKLLTWKNSHDVIYIFIFKYEKGSKNKQFSPHNHRSNIVPLLNDPDKIHSDLYLIIELTSNQPSLDAKNISSHSAIPIDQAKHLFIDIFSFGEIGRHLGDNILGHLSRSYPEDKSLSRFQEIGLMTLDHDESEGVVNEQVSGNHSTPPMKPSRFADVDEWLEYRLLMMQFGVNITLKDIGKHLGVKDKRGDGSTMRSAQKRFMERKRKLHGLLYFDIFEDDALST